MGNGCCSVGLHMLQGTRMASLMWKVSFYSITPKFRQCIVTATCICASDAKTTCGQMFEHMLNSLWTVHEELRANTALSSRQSCAETCTTCVMLQMVVQYVHTQTNQSALIIEVHVTTLWPYATETLPRSQQAFCMCSAQEADLEQKPGQEVGLCAVTR